MRSRRVTLFDTVVVVTLYPLSVTCYLLLVTYEVGDHEP